MRQFFCILCSWFIYEKNTVLCKFCEKKLNLIIKEPHVRMQGGVKHHYLFNWNSQNDLLCRRLAYHLKEKPEVFFYFFSNSYKGLKLLDKTVFACPFSKRKVNHAKSLAVSISKLFKNSSVYEVESVIEMDVPQKTLKRRERMAKLNKKVYPSLPLSNWVFVDDVLVTGSTYYNVYESIGREPQAIFTLFYKEWAYEDGSDEEEMSR